MAWMLWEMVVALLTDVEPIKLALSGAKAALGAIGSYLLKRLWRMIVGETRECMVLACKRTSNKRGLCSICYDKAKKKIEVGETTWDELTEFGLCKSDSDPFDDAYSRAMCDRPVKKEDE